MMNLTDEHQQTLKKNLLLKDLNEDQFRYFLKSSKVKSFSPNQVVIQEGSTDSDLYFVIEGQLQVYRLNPQGQEVELCLLDQGDFFGELSVFDNLPRSASIRTINASTLVSVERDAFLNFSRSYPDLLNRILKEISIRLRKSNETFFKNITQKNIELEAAYKQLKTLDEQKSKFIALTSHEIRTPLTIMIGSLQLVEEGIYGELTKDIRKTVQMSLNSAQKLNTIIDKIIDVAMNNNLDCFINKENIRITDVIKEIHEEFTVILSKRDINLSFQIPSNIKIHADRNKIKQILMNILMNAIRFTPDKGSVYMTAKYSKPDWVSIHIKDTGIGIPKEKKNLIFSPFYQIDDINAHTSGDFEFASGGIGLGLTIAKNFTELHDGNIEVLSQPGSGSEFIIHIPVGQTKRIDANF